MLNFRVLDACLRSFARRGPNAAEETQEAEGIGRFGWVTDPEGDRIELWPPG